MKKITAYICIYKFNKIYSMIYTNIHTNKLKDNLNFCKTSTNSLSGGGFALILSIPSKKRREKLI